MIGRWRGRAHTTCCDHRLSRQGPAGTLQQHLVAKRTLPLLPSDLSAQARPCGHRRSPEVIRDLTRGADAMTGRWSKPRRPPSAQSCSLVSTRYAVLIALAQCRPASVMGNSHCGNILDSAWATIHDGSGDICSAHPFLFPVSLSQVRGWWLQLRMACRRLSASRRGARDAQGGRLAQLGVGAAGAVQVVRVLRCGGAEARAARTASPTALPRGPPGGLLAAGAASPARLARARCARSQRDNEVERPICTQVREKTGADSVSARRK